MRLILYCDYRSYYIGSPLADLDRLYRRCYFTASGALAVAHIRQTFVTFIFFVAKSGIYIIRDDGLAYKKQVNKSSMVAPLVGIKLSKSFHKHAETPSYV